jgi:phosphatidylserine/phosphatidylglycerophosphate/cardiolipin synthase-like enzyme
MTGISEERLEYLQAGAWHRLTVKEIGAIAECLHVDFAANWSLVQKQGNRMGERPRP